MTEELEGTEAETTEESAAPETRVSVRDALEIAAEEHGVEDEEDGRGDTKPVTAKPEKQNQPQKPQRQISKGNIPQKATREIVQPKPESIPEPQTWSKEERAVFAQLPTEAQKAIVTREAQVLQAFRKIQSESEKLSARWREVNEAFEPQRDKLYAMGITEGNAVRRFLAWQNQMEKNPKEALSRFIASFGIKPEDLITHAQEQTQQQGYVDPRLDEVQKSVQEMRQMFEQQQQHARIAPIAHDIQAFKTQRDENGNLLRPHVDRFEPQIAQAAAQLRQAYPQASNLQILDAAYRWVIEQMTGALAPPAPQVQPQQLPTAVQQKANAARRAAGSITSTPGVNQAVPKQKPKGIRHALELAAEQHSA